jgi:hypothetical protein
MSTDLTTWTGSPVIQEALRRLQDPETPRDDKLALYAVFHQFQLRVNRVLRAEKDGLIAAMEREGLREIGPVFIKASAIDVKWPCNDEGNWADANVQEAMETYAKIGPEYFRHVPDHWEVRTAELGQGIAEGDPVAKQLHRQMKEHGWRTEEGRRLSLAVKEVREVKAA